MATKWQPWDNFGSKHHAIADGMANTWSAVRLYLPPVNFITMHHAYFIIVGLIFSVIFWGVSHPGKSVSFIDSLFLVESAFTTSGLNTVNLSQLSTAQQVILAVMMILGSPVLISLFTIWFRARIFEKRFEDIVEKERGRKMQATGTVVSMAGAMFGLPVMSSFITKRPRQRAGGSAAAAPARRGTWRQNRRAEADAFQLSGPGREAGEPEAAGGPSGQPLDPIREGRSFRLDVTSTSARPQTAVSNATTTRRRPFSRDDGRATASEGFDFRTFVQENKKSIGRNGQFFDLSDDEREYLGGVEYRALKVLFVIVAVYFVVFQLLGAITLGAWMYVHSGSINMVNSQNSWWSGIFLCISSFNNAGMTLLDAGMAAFNGDAFVLTIVSILSLAGNYAFPAFLRATVYVCSLALDRGTEEWEYTVWKEAFDFILKYPRRLYMLMFPAKANWIFIAISTSFLALDWVMLLVLCIGNPVLEVFGVGKRIGLALFQSLTLPSGGYTVISASSLYFDVQVLWVIMMYVSAYPEIIVMRNSNVYEERSLGIYTSDDDATTKDPDPDSQEKTSTDQLLPLPLSGAAHGGPPPLTPVSIAPSHFSTASGTSIKKLARVGRRGTAFVGKQIQRRLNNFQGVGVTPQPQPRPLRRAGQIRFDGGGGGEQQQPAPAAVAGEGQVSLVAQHLRGQLSHDVWFIALALFLITLMETSHSIGDAAAYSVFNFLFEVVSGYTNIGLSIGLPGESFSFSGGWYTGSKVIMVLMMVRGRHRGLPVALDHAVKLPGWDNVKKQEEDHEIRRSISARNRASAEF